MNYFTKSKRGFSATLILLLFLLVGNIGAWAQTKTLTYTFNQGDKDNITTNSWGTSYIAHRFTASNEDVTVYMGGVLGLQSSAMAMRCTNARKGEMIGNINPTYDASTNYTIPADAVGAIPGKITKITVTIAAREDRGIYIYAGTQQLVGNDTDPTSDFYTANGGVKSSILKGTTNKGGTYFVDYGAETNYTYFAITGANSGYTAISKIEITYEPTVTGPKISVNPTENTYSFNETSGNFNYTITNPVAGTNVNVTTPNNDWITLGETNTTEGLVPFTMTTNDTGIDRTGTITVKYGDATDAPTATFTVNQNKKPKTPAAISYATTEYKINLGEAFATPELTNPNNLTATYESSKPAVATVNETTGEVTIVGDGTTTITATTAETADYEAGTASYTIIVTDPNKIFTLVTVDNGLKDGDEIMLVGYNASKKEYHAMAGLNASKKTYYDETTAITVAEDLSTAVQSDDATILKVEKYGENLYLYDATNGYIYMSGDKQIGHKTNIAEADYISGTAFQDDKTVELTLSTTQSSNKFSYNPSANRFNCYAAVDGSSVKYFYIYRKTTTEPEPTTMTIDMTKTYDNDGFYYRTFSSTKAFKVPADLTVSEIAVFDGQLLVDDYKEGDVVAANTGVMLWSLEQKEFTVELSTETGTSVLGEDNMLRPSGDAGITATEMVAKDANSIFYRLTTNKDNVLCYAWGADNGAAFQLDANKAYLAVPTETAQGIKAYSFGGNGTTAIDKITDTISAKAERKVYNLQGQRVSGTPAPGLYIVNGKKVVIK